MVASMVQERLRAAVERLHADGAFVPGGLGVDGIELLAVEGAGLEAIVEGQPDEITTETWDELPEFG